ncbi:hypothetical protein K2173_011794 [Erythroxylum novogranatense]|uniref:RING-type domain-containing protein n=1 Tax=Erythroxylum novogranatense TaxID=1862640 RepID=A0AAV8S5P5_9ROSI|nr:hypothetical protein K2173_011794 [Erythroxylum novogranatense]
MGLSSFPPAAEGVLPVLVLNTVLSLALINNMVRSVLQGMGSNSWTRQDFEPDPDDNARERRVSITHAGSVGSSCNKGWITTVECCVCLCRFEGEEEVSEMSCKHFFHKSCFTCPLCRSVL